MNIVLTEDQKNASELIEKFLSNSKEKFFLLVGYAGTGKSFIIKHVLHKHHLVGKSIAVSSFTNKATNVIGSMTPFATSISLFRLLGLKTEEDSEQLIFEFKGKDKLKEFDIVVVDEVSMLSDQYFDLLKEKINKKRYIKLILMGDSAQLPPVGQESNSKVFDINNYTSETFFELKEIVRQSKNSNIPTYSFYIREIINKITQGIDIPISLKLPYNDSTINNITNNNDHFCTDNNSQEFKKTTLNDNNQSDIVFFDDSKKFMEMILEYFSNDEYSKNSDFAKVVAYRNVVIDNINNQIRNKIFFHGKLAKYKNDRIKLSKDLCALVEGENLILNAPAFDFTDEPPTNVYDTSDEIFVEKIIDYDQFKKNIYDLDFNFPFFLIKTKRKYDNKIATLKVINPLYKIKFEATMELLAKKISERPDSKKIFKNAFYPLKKEYTSLSYNYALTLHRIQGTSIDNIFVVEDDIENITKANIKTLWRSKYVYVTRPRKKLFILNRNKDRKHYHEFVDKLE